VIEVIKNAGREVYNAGDTVTYTVTVKQTADGAEARNIKIVDELPEGLTLNTDSIEGEGIIVVSAEENSYELTVESVTDELTYTYTAVTSEDVDADELVSKSYMFKIQNKAIAALDSILSKTATEDERKKE
jgi:uncharacterized repeat protein (TIGR01451 family)